MRRNIQIRMYLGDADRGVTALQIGKSSDLEFVEHFDASNRRGGHDLQTVGDHVRDGFPHEPLAGKTVILFTCICDSLNLCFKFLKISR